MAYKNLKPALKKLKKFAGPINGEKLLGMTPVGKMLGLGTPGSLEKLKGTHTISTPTQNGQKSGCVCGTVELPGNYAQDSSSENNFFGFGQVHSEDGGLF